MTLHSGNSFHSALSYADGLATNNSDIVRSGYGKIFNVEAVANSFPMRGLPSFLAYVAVPFCGAGRILPLFSC
jgi:hypothetical protein